ncbi:MAG: 2-phospho-L-lactate transferase [Deltaproteobacteria bacterium]|nr:2-phospho-L-lactate transferase [Deltaproteobacteria bacterium]
MILALTGGTGGAKLIQGLAAEIDPAELTIICNTADDAIFHGLYVSPDIDTIIYTLAGLLDQEKGWGLAGDSFAALEQLGRLGEEMWFKLGDKDLATHIRRTRLLSAGHKLSEVTDWMRTVLGVKSKVLPMSDDRIETRVVTAAGEISFQEYFVRERWSPEVHQVFFAGIDKSIPSPGVLTAIRNARGIIVCPSNPVTSIGPILAVPGIRRALVESKSRVVGVSPIIGSSSLSGPAHKLMKVTDLESSAAGVAQGYADFLTALVIGVEDEGLQPCIEKLGIKAVSANIRMNSLADKRRLAREVLALV